MLPEDVLDGVTRPKILLKAASIGQKYYSRDRDQKRLLKTQKMLKPEQAVKWLLKREKELEDFRLMGNAAYNMKLHIHVMAALLQELYLYSNESPRT
jgi:hypothetical protein